MRLIDADELKGIPIKDKLERKFQTFNLDDAYEEGWFDAIETIEKQPTADAEPIRHGHWIPFDYGDYHWHECSVCGVADKYIETVHRDGFPDKDMESIRHYCPNCGAKMDEED